MDGVILQDFSGRRHGNGKRAGIGDGRGARVLTLVLRTEFNHGRVLLNMLIDASKKKTG
jgi:hypothetical protein